MLNVFGYKPTYKILRKGLFVYLFYFITFHRLLDPFSSFPHGTSTLSNKLWYLGFEGGSPLFIQTPFVRTTQFLYLTR